MVRCCVRGRKSCFLAWINGLRDACPWALVPRDDPDIIAVDGETSRRSHDRRKGRNPLHLVSAWAARQRIVLGQQATEEKSNEITAIPLLLKHLDLKGALVTMDAMETQTDIARAIRDGGGDYCMSLTKNWPAVQCRGREVVHPSARRCDVRNARDGGPDGKAD
jgi:predicted transposase YbfD/YdcC